VRIQLIPNVPRPWLRNPATFAHSDLAHWLRTSRAALVHAALVLWRAWVVAGKPGPPADTPPLGKFEAWRHVMGGLCQVAELAGFLANQTAFYEEMATTDEPVQAFVVAWWTKYRLDLVVPVPTLFQLALKVGLAFEAPTHQGEVVRFGKWLLRLRGRLFVISETQWVRVVRSDSSHAGVRRWVLEPVVPRPRTSPRPGSPTRRPPRMPGARRMADRSGESGESREVPRRPGRRLQRAPMVSLVSVVGVQERLARRARTRAHTRARVIVAAPTLNSHQSHQSHQSGSGRTGAIASPARRHGSPPVFGRDVDFGEGVR